MCPLSAEGAAEWATAEPDRRETKKDEYTCTTSTGTASTPEGDKAEAAEQGGAPAPPAASRVARSEECQ